MKLLIGGGGTGGHIYPGLALARYVLSVNAGSEILFVGSEAGLEQKIVPASGFKLLSIPAKGFQRSFKQFGLVISSLFDGIRQAGKIIEDFKPDVVLGTGGFVAAPLVVAALLKRMPVVIHEQNALPGLANRLLAPFVSRVCISFAETAKKLSRRSRVVHTGNPRSTEVISLSRKDGCSALGLDREKAIVLVYGGSRGALRLNEVVTDYLKTAKLPEKLLVVFVTGDIYYQEISGKLEPLPVQVRLYPYLNQMPEALAAADLAVTRSGATTLAELTALGLPAILIPSPNVVNNHQYHNARMLSVVGAAVLIEEKDFNHIRLEKEINRLITNPDLRSTMQEKSKALGVTDAAQRLYHSLEEVAL
jgi:UDP-N-acetylglucosamine--N-acetylmuramyl-(pentapeptide) pyrophosphoryl-undecaprenol N-acetylglucosamine transferase